MKIETKFSNGDVVYATQKDYITSSLSVIGPLTIGQVRVEVTDSDGVDWNELFDNYKKQKKCTEKYMCVETGIGSGTLYNVIDMFTSKEEAVSFVKEYNEIEF